MTVDAVEYERADDWYAHYQDKYELLDEVERRLIDELDSIAQASSFALRLYGIGSDNDLLRYFTSIAEYYEARGWASFSLPPYIFKEPSGQPRSRANGPIALLDRAGEREGRRG